MSAANHTTNETHDPALRSWVASANAPGCDFPIQNLPFAMLRRQALDAEFRVAVAIGDYALDLRALHATGVCASPALDACQGDSLNALMALGRTHWSHLRLELSRALRTDAAERARLEPCLIPLAEVEYALPARIGDYTDFYTSIHHATNIGRLFRPDNPLLPNYEWVPIGYHGRSSSIGVSGQTFPRPVGQLKAPDSDVPTVAPCARLDYELEVGIFVGAPNAPGQPVSMQAAEEHVFGLCLLNDWSARDVQAWEYQPLGPFLAKNFASTISPWIVTLEALAPFRAPFTRVADRPAPLPYLTSADNDASGALDMQLEVYIETEQMRAAGDAPHRLSRSNFTDSFWTIAQMVTHHTMNGCNLQPGDLLGSGTMSGAEEGSQAALIEITAGGKHPVSLPNGETRTFLEDQDAIILAARCEADGAVGVGFGQAVGRVLPARVSGE
ncbi:MAG: fumarylacetoacetase [Pseudomonadota bacterium]